MFKRSTEERSRNQCYRASARSIIHSECVSVALVIQHVKNMNLIILSSVACPALQYFSFLAYYVINGKIFGNKLLDTKCLFWFPLQFLPETFLILRRIQRDIIINVQRSACKVAVILVRLLHKVEVFWNSSFLDSFSKTSNIKFHKNPSGESRVVPCGRTDKHNESNSYFPPFCECAKKKLFLHTVKPRYSTTTCSTQFVMQYGGSR